MAEENSDITYFGVTNFRRKRLKFGIKPDDRRRHLYIVGKTGMGKTALLENMAFQDIQAGRGVGFIDPHGEAAERLLEFIPKERINDVVYFNPADINYPIPFNVMEQVGPEFRHLVASGLMATFKKIWPDVWSARMEYLLHNAILALLETPNSTILGINRVLSDSEYRKKVVEKVKDPIVKSFWQHEFARYNQRYEVEATAAVQNKIGQFISNPLIRNIVGQVKSSIDMRRIMDEGKILIINLSKGRVGEENSLLLGALMVTRLQLAAMSRVDVPENQRRDFYLYVDEFQNFATEAFATILSEARKYRLSLILAHQYLAQLDQEKGNSKVRDAVFGNVGTMVAFRVGAEDAEFLEREFMPEFIQKDLVNLPKYHIYAKLMVDGVTTRPFSALTLPPYPLPFKSQRGQVIKVSRERYGVGRELVEEKIAKWVGFLGELPKPTINVAQGQGELHDAICSRCGKPTKVPFSPDGKRPTYCKSCRNKLKLDQQIVPEMGQFVSLTKLPSRGEASRTALVKKASSENIKPIRLKELREVLHKTLDSANKNSE